MRYNTLSVLYLKNIYQQFSITLYSTNCNFKGNFTRQSENNNATVIKATILLQCVLYNPVTHQFLGLTLYTKDNAARYHNLIYG